MVYPALLPLMRTPRLPVVDWTDDPADLNGLVCFAERRNLVYARAITFQTQSIPDRHWQTITVVICYRRPRTWPHSLQDNIQWLHRNVLLNLPQNKQDGRKSQDPLSAYKLLKTSFNSYYSVTVQINSIHLHAVYIIIIPGADTPSGRRRTASR